MCWKHSSPSGSSCIGQLSERFVEVAILSNERAIGLFNRTGDLGSIDLTTKPAPVEVLPFAENTKNITLSPNKRYLFAASLKDSSVTKIDLETNTLVASVNVPIAPARHATVFGPSLLPPALITVNGGNNQFIPPDIVVPVAVSVRVTDEEGSPIAGVPVLFAAESSPVEVLIEAAGSGLTNSLGVASAVVTIPPIPPPVEEEAAAALADTEVTELAASDGETTGEAVLSASAVEPEPVEQEVDVIDPIILTARTVGLEPALIQLNLIRATGIIKVSGDFQVTAPLKNFRLPFRVLVTDETGLPLPPGTIVNFNAFQARCAATDVPTDANGFAEVRCAARSLSQGAGTQRPGQVIAGVPDFLELGFTKFALSVALGADLITVEKISGDGQAAPAGEPLPEPLRLRLGLNFGASGDVGIQMSQVSGPVVNLSPTFLVTPAGFTQSVQVTLGPNAGNVVIQAEALSPKAPSVTFNITATGGLPESFQIEGNGQSGRVGKELPMPLRMRVINESGGVVPFPEVSWAVVEGGATLVTATDPDGATARVMMGDVPGPIQVSAMIAGLTAVFDLTATPPDPVSISTVSGQNQILAAGDVSEPLIALVREIENVPASNVAVEFSGPSFVILHPLDGGAPGNPVSQVTGPDGQAAVRVELPIVAGVSLGSNDQFSRTISIVADVGDTLSTTFVLGSIGRTPSFVSEGIVNAATFQAGIVPGSLASLFGDGLSEGISETVVAGGSTSFEGTTVLIGGVPAPLLSITGSPVEQINLQVPFELSTGTTTTIEVENNGTRTTVGGVPVFSTQPGIFEIPDPAGGTVGAVIDARTFEPITTDNPAARDRPLSVFFTGGGELEPTVLTGVFGPVPPAVMTGTVVVGVDDKGAEVLFKKGFYAPGFLGLYQVNINLPEDAGCGVRNLVIRVGGSFSLDSKTVIQCP